MKNPTLSVIMPALNEENNIEEAIKSTLDAFKKHNIDGEIIVINDGSSDKTGKIVEEIIKINNRVFLVNHEKPMGIGYSFWDGVKTSTRDVVVLFSGDNENDPESALEYFYLMNNVDIIVPFILNIEVRERIRRIISSVYRFIINISFGLSLNYTNGTVFYRRIILDDINLKNSGFFYQAEILTKLIRMGYLFVEIPNYLKPRLGGKSKALTLNALINLIKGYLRLAYDIHVKQIDSDINRAKLNKNSISYQKYKDFQEKIK